MVYAWHLGYFVCGSYYSQVGNLHGKKVKDRQGRVSLAHLMNGKALYDSSILDT